MRAWSSVGGAPRFVASAKGCRITDVEVSYLDAVREPRLGVHDEPLRSDLGKLVIRQAVKMREMLRVEPLNAKRHRNLFTGTYAHLGSAADAGVPLLASKF